MTEGDKREIQHLPLPMPAVLHVFSPPSQNQNAAENASSHLNLQPFLPLPACNLKPSVILKLKFENLTFERFDIFLAFK